MASFRSNRIAQKQSVDTASRYKVDVLHFQRAIRRLERQIRAILAVVASHTPKTLPRGLRRQAACTSLRDSRCGTGRESSLAQGLSRRSARLHHTSARTPSTAPAPPSFSSRPKICERCGMSRRRVAEVAPLTSSYTKTTKAANTQPSVSSRIRTRVEAAVSREKSAAGPDSSPSHSSHQEASTRTFRTAREEAMPLRHLFRRC